MIRRRIAMADTASASSRLACLVCRAGDRRWNQRPAWNKLTGAHPRDWRPIPHRDELGRQALYHRWHGSAAFLYKIISSQEATFAGEYLVDGDEFTMAGSRGPRVLLQLVAGLHEVLSRDPAMGEFWCGRWGGGASMAPGVGFVANPPVRRLVGANVVRCSSR